MTPKHLADLVRRIAVLEEDSMDALVDTVGKQLLEILYTGPATIGGADMIMERARGLVETVPWFD